MFQGTVSKNLPGVAINLCIKQFCPDKDRFSKVRIMVISYVSAVSKNTVSGYHCCYVF
jgi:hypothetical protein